MIRLVIVDDSAAFRLMLRRALAADPGIEVVGEAADPFEARDRIAALKPDVVTLDVHMPRMDGAEFLRHLMRVYPLPVIVITGDAADSELIHALRVAGAAAVIDKPASGGRAAFNTTLIDTIRAVVPAPAPDRIEPRRAPGPSLIAIGASTGGMAATAQVLAGLGADCPPVVIAQHVDANASDTYATWLARHAPMRVREARRGDPLEPGLALLAPFDRHLRVVWHDQRLVAHLTAEDPVNGHRPSVDVLFSSVAKLDRPGTVGVLLTGMGADGARGLLELRQRGARTLVQDPVDCVVPGMPEAAMRAGAAVSVVRLSELARTLLAAAVLLIAGVALLPGAALAEDAAAVSGVRDALARPDARDQRP